MVDDALWIKFLMWGSNLRPAGGPIPSLVPLDLDFQDVHHLQPLPDPDTRHTDRHATGYPPRYIAMSHLLSISICIYSECPTLH